MSPLNLSKIKKSRSYNNSIIPHAVSDSAFKKSKRGWVIFPQKWTWKKSKTWHEQICVPQNGFQDQPYNKTCEDTLTNFKWQAAKYSRMQRRKRNPKVFIPGQSVITNFVQVIRTVEKLLNVNRNVRLTLATKLQESNRPKQYNLNSNRLLWILVEAVERNGCKNKNGNRFDTRLDLFVAYIWVQLSIDLSYWKISSPIYLTDRGGAISFQRIRGVCWETKVAKFDFGVRRCD